MKILLINPPHQAIGSRLPREHLPPLGLLSVAGPLIDAGHDVELMDADYSNMKHRNIVKQAVEAQPDMVGLGHSGSTSAQPIINELARRIKEADHRIEIIVGGVFPTYHWPEVLADNRTTTCTRTIRTTDCFGDALTIKCPRSMLRAAARGRGGRGTRWTQCD